MRPPGCSRPDAASGLGLGEQQARQSRRPLSWSGPVPPSRTLPLGLAGGPSRHRTTSKGLELRLLLTPWELGRGSMTACGCGHAPKKGTHKAPSLCLTRGTASRTRRKAAAAARHCGSDSANHRRKCQSRKRTARRSAPSAVRQRTKSSEIVAQHRRDRSCGNWSEASTDCACPGPRCPSRQLAVRHLSSHLYPQPIPAFQEQPLVLQTQDKFSITPQ